MYTCKMCKKSANGEAALRNRTGTYCPECKEIIYAKSAEALRARNAALSGYCLWCGEKITSATKQTRKDNNNVCQSCETNRRWLLRMIRISDRPARYVARIEKRESPMRQDRKKAMQDEKPTIVAEEYAPNSAEARLRRLELMLNKLTQALGL